MPAIASLEDLKAAQEELRSRSLVFTTYALRFTPDGLSEDGERLVGKISVSCGLRRGLQNS